MAENEELAKALKDLPLKVQTPSLKIRKEVIQNVINILPHPGINENIVRGICKVLHLTLLRYNEGASQLLVRNLIAALLEHYPKWTVKSFLTVLMDIAGQFKSLVVTPSTSKSALTALNWSCLLMVNGWKNEEVIKDDISTLVDVQAILLTAVVSAGIQKYSLKAYNMLHNSWTSVPAIGSLYIDSLKLLEQTYFIPVLGSALIKHLSLNNNSLVDKCMDGLLDTFIKTLISCKTKPLKTIVEACYPLLKKITHEQFKGLLLPALQKAMLRNPEIIIECVGLVLSGISLDLSQYAGDVGKSLITNLHSKADITREESADACKRLAQQCSDSGAIESLLKQVFAVFHGSDGKLTVVDHKISVLQGAGNLSYNAVSGSSLQHLTSVAADQFIKVLEVEVHERTLCHALDMLSLWVCKFSNEVPKKVIDAFKNGMGLKTSTALVRTSYIQCMSACFHSNTIAQAVILIPTLQKAIDRAIAQPTQASAVTEGLCAACFLLKIAATQGDKENNFSSLWTILFDMDKQLFVSEKFLSVASDDALIHVMQLCERLLLEHPERLNGKAGPLHRAVLICLTASSTAVRRKCLPLARRIVGGLGGISLARALLKDLTKYLENSKIQNKNENENRDQNDASNEISPHTVIECITALCSSSGSAEDAQLVALEALLPTHNPAIVNIAPDLWIKIVKRLGLEPHLFVEQQLSNLKKLLIEEFTATPEESTKPEQEKVYQHESDSEKY